MNEWWDGLSLLLKVLYCIAFPSTLILLVQTLLSMFGFHDGGSGHDFSDTSGLDLDVDANISAHGDVDIGHCTHDIGCDHNVDGGNPADFASMRMFTLQTIVAFFTVFSWSSIVLVSSGVYPALSTVIGFVLGLATMLLVAKIYIRNPHQYTIQYFPRRYSPEYAAHSALHHVARSPDKQRHPW